MAKKPSETSAPEASAAQKPATRKTAARKAAAPAKKTAAKAEEKPADAASVEAPKTKIKTVKSAAKTAARTKTVKAAKKTAVKESPAAEAAPAPAKTQESASPSSPQIEKNAVSEPVKQPESGSPVKVKRESYRPNRNQDQQERHEQHGNESFAQPETVGGGSDTPFNKRKRRRRNKKGNGGADDRQPAMQDTASLKNLDGKKVAARAWKMFLAEVSEEGLALMDDQTAREAARRAFRCAEFFMMEESRRKQSLKAVSQQGRNASQEEDRDAEEATGEE